MTKMDFDKKLGIKIKLLRIKQNFSQEKLADLAGLNKNSIGLIERGKSNPTTQTLKKIAIAFGIELEQLMDVTKIKL